MRLTVVKKDGRRVPWDRTRILTGLERACFKRPVPQQEIARVVDEVEDEIFKTHDREVPSTIVGELVTDRLRRLDQVAYVRFASVYRRFKTLEELVDEARAVIDARRYEDPGQGKLFVDASAAATGEASVANGDDAHARDNGNAGHPPGSEKPRKRSKRAENSSRST